MRIPGGQVARVARRLPRRVQLGGALVAALLVVVAIALTRGGSSAQSVRADVPADTTTTTSTTVSTTTTTTLAPETVPSTTAAPAPTTKPAPAVDPCRNSFDPSCGEFHWDPPIANKPLHITLTASNTHPAVGETITLTAKISDSDAVPNAHCVAWLADTGTGPTFMTFGDGAENCGTRPPCEQPPARYGAWDPLPTHGGSIVATFDTSVRDTNPVVFSVQAFSGEVVCSGSHGLTQHDNVADSGLYASSGEAEVTVAAS